MSKSRIMPYMCCHLLQVCLLDMFLNTFKCIQAPPTSIRLKLVDSYTHSLTSHKQYMPIMMQHTL